MNETLGLKVRKVRELKNFSQTYVADKLSISQSAYSDLENCRIQISDDRLAQIASILEVDENAIRNFNDQVVFNSCVQSGQFNTYHIKNPTEKIDELYNSLLQSKDELISQLKQVIDEKDRIIRQLQNGAE